MPVSRIVKRSRRASLVKSACSTVKVTVPRRVGELDGVAEDVDEHLPESERVADEILVRLPDHTALVAQSLVLTLTVDDNVDLLRHFPERELLRLELHAARLDAAHVQDVVDEGEQVPGAGADLFQFIAGARREVRIAQGNAVQPDDRVHGRADLMAHGAEEGRLCSAGLLRTRQRLRQSAILLHGPARLPVNIGKARADRVDDVIFTLLDGADPRDAKHLVPLLAVLVRQIPMGDHGLGCKLPAYVFRIDEAEEALPVRRRDTVLRIVRQAFPKRKGFPFAHFSVWFIGRADTDALVLVEIGVVDAPVISGHGRDHAMEDLAVLVIQIDQNDGNGGAGPCAGHAGLDQTDERTDDGDHIEDEELLDVMPRHLSVPARDQIQEDMGK